MEKERKKKQNVSTLRFKIPSRLLPLESRSLCFQFCEVVAYQETRFILRQTNRSGFYDKYFFSCFNDENCVDCASEFKHLFFNPFPAKCQFVFQIETSPHFVVIDTILKFIKILFLSAVRFVFFLRFFFPFSIYWKKCLNGYTKKKSSSWPTSLNNLSHKPQPVSCPL